MILRRLGNKSKLAESIYKTFPKHDVYLEPFFGTGAMYFKKPRARHNVVNDIDDDVFNLWNVYTHNFNELLEAIHDMPRSESLFNHWKENTETNPILKALRFLFLSNFSYLGTGNSFLIMGDNAKDVLIEKYKQARNYLYNVTISNLDFRAFYSSVSVDYRTQTALAYNDPPYLEAYNNYSHSFKEQDSIDLFDILDSKSKEYPSKFFYAISEFNHPFILEQAKKRNLNIIDLDIRRSINNRNTEILITNYETELSLFDSLGGACNSKSSLAFV
ncbi:MAG: DNA adenine methylase [Leptospiraceae bacterium]|nr:DNA adenine methylase [Leptospiraceae bacterium]